MKLLILAGTLLWCVGIHSIWQPDFETAKKVALEKNQLILINFSGSDWCGPCIRMKKEIFDHPSFSAFSDSNLVLLNADFPRNKKNQLSPSVQQHNEALAEKFNRDGNFPYTVLIDANEKVIQTWEGFPKGGLNAFILSIKQFTNERK